MRIRWFLDSHSAGYRAATTDYVICEMRIVRLMHTACFIATFSALRCGIPRVWDLFTLKIRDSAHPLSRSWNFSSDVGLDDMPLVSLAQIDTSIYLNVYILNVTFVFVFRHKFAVERGVHFHTIMSFYSVSHTLEHYFSRVFQKPVQLEFFTAPVNIWLSYTASISLETRDLS